MKLVSTPERCRRGRGFALESQFLQSVLPAYPERTDLPTRVWQSGQGTTGDAAGALVQKVNAACPDCPDGIDLTQANFSISIFARSILAN